MSITYHAYTARELPKAGIEDGEIAIYTGTIRGGLCGGPTTSDCARAVYVYRWVDGCGAGDVATDSTGDGDGPHVLDFTAGTDHYVFARNGARTFLRQLSGPAKPVVVGNIGADPIRVDTKMGKFMVPAGTVLRLDRNTPFQRERKKVLLTFGGRGDRENLVESALVLEDGRWRPLNICASDGIIQIKDGPFVVQTLACARCPSTVTLKDPPSDPDYEIYFRRTAHLWPKVRFAGLGMKDEGLTRKHHDFHPNGDVIYDFQKLRQAYTEAQMRQCTAQLPGLEGQNAPPEQNVPWPEPLEDKTVRDAIFAELSGWTDFPAFPDLPQM